MKGICIQAFMCLCIISISTSVCEENENALGEANQQFAVNIYKKLADENPGRNLFLSPLSIFIAFGMVNLGTRGRTMSQLREVLHLNGLNSDDAINDGYKQLIRKLKSTANNYTLHLANRLFGSKEFQIKDKFLQDADGNFQASLEKLDFIHNPEESRHHINQFVENQTNGKIKDLLSSGTIGPQTVLVLVNAIYFKAGWLHQFEKRRTKPAPFHISKDEQVQMDQMSMSAKYLNYYRSEDMNCEIVELPYLDNRVSMFVFLPREIDGLTKLEKQLTGETLIQTLRSNLTNQRRIEVKMPKFEMDQDISLKKFLQSLGMVDLFEASRCNLSGIADDNRLVVSDAMHKAFIKVDEIGTEAAAATGIGIVLTSVPQEFIVDRPFFFLIFEKSTESILFLGRLGRPPKTNDSIGKFGEASALKTDGATATKSTIANIIIAVVVVLNFFTKASLFR